MCLTVVSFRVSVFCCDENIDECTSWSGWINRFVLSMVRLYRSVNTYWLKKYDDARPHAFRRLCCCFHFVLFVKKPRFSFVQCSFYLLLYHNTVFVSFSCAFFLYCFSAVCIAVALYIHMQSNVIHLCSASIGKIICVSAVCAFVWPRVCLYWCARDLRFHIHCQPIILNCQHNGTMTIR